ncbi:hypothetical protein GS421_07625 [Rhodococcus hoagii]|nr:hypothetical protein [Prescottella equi]
MSTRDELANLIAQADSQEVGRWIHERWAPCTAHLADAILAAGYSRPRGGGPSKTQRRCLTAR